MIFCQSIGKYINNREGKLIRNGVMYYEEFKDEWYKKQGIYDDLCFKGFVKYGM